MNSRASFTAVTALLVLVAISLIALQQSMRYSTVPLESQALALQDLQYFHQRLLPALDAHSSRLLADQVDAVNCQIPATVTLNLQPFLDSEFNSSTALLKPTGVSCAITSVATGTSPAVSQSNSFSIILALSCANAGLDLDYSNAVTTQKFVTAIALTQPTRCNIQVKDLQSGQTQVDENRTS